MTWHLVTTDFPPMLGGIATWAMGIARALHGAGEPVVVYVPRRLPPMTTPFPVVRMWGRSWRRWQGLWAALAVLPRLRPGDRVLCATWPLAVHIVEPARWRGVSVGVCYHGSDLTRPPVVPGLDRVRRAAIHLPVSRYLGDLLGAPYTVLPMPIDPKPEALPGEELLTIARLGPLKGVDRVIALGSRLGRPVRIVGDGPERAALEAYAQKLGVDAKFTGALRPDEISWDGVWALALLSRTAADGSGAEGLGMVLLEAAARGIPTIGSHTGGIPEAAMVLLDNPLQDPLPMMPNRTEARNFLQEHHGSGRSLSVLREKLVAARTLL